MLAKRAFGPVAVILAVILALIWSGTVRAADLDDICNCLYPEDYDTGVYVDAVNGATSGSVVIGKKPCSPPANISAAVTVKFDWVQSYFVAVCGGTIHATASHTVNFLSTGQQATVFNKSKVGSCALVSGPTITGVDVKISGTDTDLDGETCQITVKPCTGCAPVGRDYCPICGVP